MNDLEARSTGDPITELLAAYALHAVTPQEAALVEEHLPTCEDCQRELQALSMFQELLPELVPVLDPPPGLKTRLMAQIAQEMPPRRIDSGVSNDEDIDPPPMRSGSSPDQTFPPATPPVRLVTSPASSRISATRSTVAQPVRVSLHAPQAQANVLPLARQSRTRGMIYSLLAVAAVVVILVGVVTAYQNSRRPITSPAQLVATIAGQAALPTAHGSLTYYPTGKWAELNIQGMRVLPLTRVYELWLINSHGARPAGTFRSQSNGKASLRVTQNLTLYTKVGITIERAAGSTTPTLPIVAAGSVTL